MDDAAAYGIDLPDAGREEDYGIWPENLQAVELFLRSSTQWRVGAGGVYGLDYPAVLAVATLYLPADAEMPAILEDVQTMERRALELFKEHGEKERG